MRVEADWYFECERESRVRVRVNVMRGLAVKDNRLRVAGGE